MNIRRVLMTGDTVGGVWTFTLELAAALGREGIEVVLAVFGGDPTEAQCAEAASIPSLCLLKSHFKLEWMDDPWTDIEESGRWLMRLEREYSPDLVHLSSFGHGALPWRSPPVLTAHSCVLSWWSAVKGEPAPAAWRRYEMLVGNSLRAAAAVTAPSRAMAGELTRFYGITPGKCVVIPNGRSASGFHRAEKESFVFTAGRLWDEGKNVGAVAQIAPRLPWPVYVAGETGRIPVAGCISLGRLTAPEMADWYSRASIYAMPARYEPFGLSIVEAALSGCALVLGDIQSLREIWGDAALFAAPDDVSSLEQAIRALIGDPSLRERMARHAYRRALQFDTDSMGHGYLDTYQRTLAARNQLCVS